MAELTYSKLKVAHLEDKLVVKKSKGKISAHLDIVNFIDKDTKQYVILIPSLQISGYGESSAKAQEMIDASVKEYFSYLLDLNLEDLKKELAGLGFIQAPMFKKEYSKMVVDANGDLQGINAEEGSIERSLLTAA